MGGHQRIARPTPKPTPQNRIYYGIQLKRTTIFRHPYKKCKWPNHHRYLPQIKTPNNTSTSIAPPPKKTL